MSTMASNTPSPVFPPEVTNLIIANLPLGDMSFSELAQLWVAAPIVSAFVSTGFEDEIRKVFAQKVLPELTLEYKLGSFYFKSIDSFMSDAGLKNCLMPTSPGEDSHMAIFRAAGFLNMSLCFAKFSMDDSRAIYKSGRTMFPSGAIAAYSAHVDEMVITEKLFFGDLKYFTDEDRKYPIHITQLKGVFNDTGLPGFKIDVEKREVEFDWQELFSRLFDEEMSSAAVEELDAIEAFCSGKGFEAIQEDKRKIIRHDRFNSWFDSKLDSVYLQLPAVSFARDEAFKVYEKEYASLVQYARERMDGSIENEGVIQDDGNGRWSALRILDAAWVGRTA